MSSISTTFGQAWRPAGTYLKSLGDIYNLTGKSTSVASANAPVNPTVAVPTAEVGAAIPYNVGRFLVTSANVIWVGNLTPLYDNVVETTQTREPYFTQIGPGMETWDLVTTTTVITQYIKGYTLDSHIGICLGPDVVLRGIWYNNEKIWNGSIGPARTSVTLPENDTALSGAEVIFHGGAFDQTVDPTVTDPDMPAYVGVAYVIVRNMRADIPLQNLQFEVERFPNVLALAAGVNKFNDDLNTVSAIADIITNSWGGAGLDVSSIDIANLKTAASVAASENNGCAMATYGAGVKNMLDNLLGQIYGILYQNPETGKLEISLIRDDALVFSDDANFGNNNLVALRSFKKSSWSNTIDKMNGAYTNREDSYKPGTLLVQNIGSIGSNKVSGQSYPYISNATLCLAVVSRDLGLASSPLFKIQAEAMRKAAPLLPGDVVFVSWDTYHLYGVPILVTKVRKLPVEQNTIIFEGQQYLLPEITPVFEIPSTPFDPGIDVDPKAPTTAYIITVPYWIASRIGLVGSDTNSKVISPMFLPKPANSLQSSYSVRSKYMSNGSGLNDEYIVYIKQSIYPTYGQLSVAIGKYDGWTTGTLASIVLDGVINPGNLINVGTAGAHEGKLLAVIDNEFFSFTSYAVTGPNQVTLSGVNRALVDSVAADHPQNSDVYIFSNNYNNIIPTLFNYPLSSRPSWKIPSNVVNENGNVNNVDDYLITDAWAPNTLRTLAPVRPHDTKIEGVRNSTKVDIFLGSDVTVSWRTRARKSPQIQFQVDASEESETLPNGKYQYHTICVQDGGGTEREVETTPSTGGPTFNTLEVTFPAGGYGLGDGWLYVKSKLDLQFGTVENVFQDRLPVQILAAGTLLTEDDASFIGLENGSGLIVQEG